MSADPFLLPRPAVISFSGGRTSGLMLRRVLDAFWGRLPDDIAVVFCNTGKERVETLDEVERCSIEWDVPIVWLEYRRDAKHKFVEVNYATASRNGEPFLELICAKATLPNVARHAGLSLYRLRRRDDRERGRRPRGHPPGPVRECDGRPHPRAAADRRGSGNRPARVGGFVARHRRIENG